MSHSSQGSAALKEVGQVGDQNTLWGDVEGAVKNVWGSHGDGCYAFLPMTILDNILTVGELASGEEQSERPHSPSHARTSVTVCLFLFLFL